MNRFFVKEKQISGNTVKILGQDVRHIKDVLRLKEKDKVEVACDNKNYICEITKISPECIILLVLDAFEETNEPPITVSLYQGVPKGDKMDFIIQKCTEVGMAEIYPIITDRTVIKIKNRDKEQKKLSRWRMIAEEAAKQSKRNSIPAINNIISFDDMIDNLKGKDNIIVPYEKEAVCALKDALRNVQSKEIRIVIGPEGGFTDEEIDSLKHIGAKSVTLGPRILRTETAGIAVLSIVLYELGDLGVRI